MTQLTIGIRVGWSCLYVQISKRSPVGKIQPCLHLLLNRRNSKNFQSSLVCFPVRLRLDAHTLWPKWRVRVGAANGWNSSKDRLEVQSRLTESKKKKSKEKWMALSTIGGCDNCASMVKNPRRTAIDRFGKEFYYKAGRVSWTKRAFKCACPDPKLSSNHIPNQSSRDHPTRMTQILCCSFHFLMELLPRLHALLSCCHCRRYVLSFLFGFFLHQDNQLLWSINSCFGRKLQIMVGFASKHLRRYWFLVLWIVEIFRSNVTVMRQTVEGNGRRCLCISAFSIH